MGEEEEQSYLSCPISYLIITIQCRVSPQVKKSTIKLELVFSIILFILYYCYLPSWDNSTKLICLVLLLSSSNFNNKLDSSWVGCPPKFCLPPRKQGSGRASSQPNFV